MENHELLQEIVKMMEAQETRLTSQTAQLRQEMQAGNAALRQEIKESRTDILNQVGQFTSEIVQAIGEQLQETEERIVREVRILTENIEGRKIRILADESQAHKETLADHEKRIGHLELTRA